VKRNHDMSAKQLMEQILPVLYTVKEDEEKLQKILDFLLAEIYEEPQEEEISEKYRKVVQFSAPYYH
jgi:hypothetical protein